MVKMSYPKFFKGSVCPEFFLKEKYSREVSRPGVEPRTLGLPCQCSRFDKVIELKFRLESTCLVIVSA